ncbi:Processing alpha glucosidase I [Komagataella phaffii CBS 7435]|uniref:Mannosyl-oligosaccharide glucosidase n=2 Tax=Komagataella phaffii TaxID=460519 RepID=C4QWG2_KOMPG|nr:Processing alpha glucosidase I, ER type II integral membrane N-glycoprotein [Komagataella phaffii GS115]AOA61544.1 GQ67_02798T0 [Komagataella phaffii]CAH2446254.1 Processing alpha glucosidase I [Komagataella phaffii CBS 7435]AOA66000.1 GQ68_02450T0 [Komagataella phaffii GS115]CAY67585.1 Processing alpha glucosidase I, ER type II integral membrane N-glycoprotein [Komagataella phaffii GS115]CCA36680.1 Processing alpha glucosidase I [Komagataella phaffii CBS 7435]
MNLFNRRILSLISVLVVAIAFENVPSDELSLPEAFQKISDQSLLWGPYRSNLYVGIKPKIPHSFLSGLMWFNADDPEGIVKLRHSCEQDPEIQSFGWVKYDARVGGRHIIKDRGCKVLIKSDFVKTSDGNWALKITGVPKKGQENVKTSLIFYAGTEEDQDNMLMFAGNKDEFGNVNNDLTRLTGVSKVLGGAFELLVEDGPSNRYPSATVLAAPDLDPSLTHHLSLHVPDEHLWQAKEVFISLLQESVGKIREDPSLNVSEIPVDQLTTLRNINNFEGNLHFIQKTFQGKFELNIIFNLEDAPEKLSSSNIDSYVDRALTHFDEKFSSQLQFQAPFHTKEYLNFGKEFLSNLAGGIGYFYGEQLVDRNAFVDDDSFDNVKLVGKPEGPSELFTSVPSRPFFPRGFYWDEGFHLLSILDYDSDLALEILKSWFALIDDDGWIAREQILGPEARSRVPAEFQVQNPNIANPPTLMLVFAKLLNMAHDSPKSEDDFVSIQDLSENMGHVHLDNPEILVDYAEDIYPRLKKHFEWFATTQKGETLGLSRESKYPNQLYRWIGRTKDLCLPSGLDDYPRASEPDSGELNIDLLSWMGLMSRSMKSIAKLLNKADDVHYFETIEQGVLYNLDQIHWSEEEKSYCDITVDDDDNDVFECHKGYVTLLPFALKLIPEDSERLIHVLQDLRDPDICWSQFGIRSLSKSHPLFHSGEDYWRGNIWLNINYLILDALKHYAESSGALPDVKEMAKPIYKELREILVTNVYNEFKRTGYAWEQYNEATGKGQRTRHFLGWTSLVIPIMKMPEELA